MDWTIDWAERAWLPDSIIRWGIRQRLKRWYRDADLEKSQEEKRALVQQLRQSPIALSTETANTQHYEIPAEFFGKFLGRQRKYSSCLWEADVRTLDDAEERMLALTAQRAGIHDGDRVLELGCGWGSLTLWLARHFPQCTILAVSNSSSQREYIQSIAHREGLGRIEIITADLNDFQTDRTFDRIVSVECFEHLRNYQKMFARMSRWLTPKGRCLLHVFCHREFAYTFEGGESDWMGEYFFQSGIMPSEDLFSYFNDDLRIVDRWRVSGRHYARTLNTWLEIFDTNRPAIEIILKDVYPPEQRRRWMQRWRLFFMGCAELFAYADGNEWFVAHYLLAPHSDRAHTSTKD
jgi:cyclopropane-fatty-acyl-phospholipid synthase